MVRFSPPPTHEVVYRLDTGEIVGVVVIPTLTPLLINEKELNDPAIPTGILNVVMINNMGITKENMDAGVYVPSVNMRGDPTEWRLV